MAHVQKEYVGIGEISKLPEIIRGYEAQKIFLVTGKSSYLESGAKKWVDAVDGVEWHHFNNVGVLPTQENIDEGVAMYKECAPDLVVAIGGGSVIDVAKAINHVAGQKPLIAIPTTAGSGSEATHFAVVYKGGIKHSLSDESILPEVCIVDPALSFSVPAPVALASGLDAFTQAIESYWSREATRESREYALSSLRLSVEHIAPALLSRDPEAMIKMSEAAHLAGKAINISKTTACHALSYGLTARFGVPHGIAVATLLPAVYAYNAEANHETFEALNATLGCATSEEAVQWIKELLAKFGILTLAQYGLAAEHIPALVGEINHERLNNNPRSMPEAEIENIYRSLI